MTHPDVDPVERLHTLVRAAVGEHRPSGPLAALLELDVLAPWQEYTAALFETTIPLSTKKLLHQAWHAAARHQAPVRPQETKPLVATPMAELRASTAAEFVDLLELVQVRSGLTLPEIHRRAGQVLPRSQVYSLLRRRKLPTKPEQVRVFVTICGLSEPQVARVMELWATLREQTELAVSDAEGDRPFAILIVRSA